MKSNVLMFMGLLLLTGCTRHIPCVANPFTTIASPKATIEQVIQEQPLGYTPADVIVTDDYFNMITYVTKRKFFPKGITSLPVPTIIYYNNIGSVKLIRKRGWYRITIWDKSGVFNCRIFTFP